MSSNVLNGLIMGTLLAMLHYITFLSLCLNVENSVEKHQIVVRN